MYILLLVLIMWETLKEHTASGEFWKYFTALERGKSEQLMGFSALQGILTSFIAKDFNHFYCKGFNHF